MNEDENGRIHSFLSRDLGLESCGISDDRRHPDRGDPSP